MMDSSRSVVGHPSGMACPGVHNWGGAKARIGWRRGAQGAAQGRFAGHPINTPPKAP